VEEKRRSLSGISSISTKEQNISCALYIPHVPSNKADIERFNYIEQIICMIKESANRRNTKVYLSKMLISGYIYRGYQLLRRPAIYSGIEA